MEHDSGERQWRNCTYWARRGPTGNALVERFCGPIAEGRKPAGKGVRAARTICQWQIVRPERTARKRRAGKTPS
jgi:hypothetical protein